MSNALLDTFLLLFGKALQHCNLLGPAALVGRFENKRNIVKACIARNISERCNTQISLTHRRVAVHATTQHLHRIVQMHTAKILESHLALKLCKHLFATLLGLEVITRSEGVAGVKTYAHARLILHAVNNICQVPKRIAEI